MRFSTTPKLFILAYKNIASNIPSSKKNMKFFFERLLSVKIDFKNLETVFRPKNLCSVPIPSYYKSATKKWFI